MSTSEITAPEIPGMVHAGWTCEHDTTNPDDVHTAWRPRRRKPGWKRKKSPGTIRSIESVGKDWNGNRPSEPGCLKARPLYEKLDEEKAPGVKIPDGAPLYAGRDGELGERYPAHPQWLMSSGAWTLPEFKPGARKWDNLADVPEDVAMVRGANSVVLMRVYSLGAGHDWMAAAGPNSDLVADAPYTEIVGAQ